MGLKAVAVRPGGSDPHFIGGNLVLPQGASIIWTNGPAITDPPDFGLTQDVTNPNTLSWLDQSPAANRGIRLELRIPNAASPNLNSFWDLSSGTFATSLASFNTLANNLDVNVGAGVGGTPGGFHLDGPNFTSIAGIGARADFGFPTSGYSQPWGRINGSKGTDINAIATITLGDHDNGGCYYHIATAGAITTNLLESLNWNPGTRLTFRFDAAITIKHNQAVAGTAFPYFNASGADIVTTADQILEYVLDTTAQKWYQIP